MRVRSAIALASLTALALSAGGALLACFDLLHSTADVLTACELDAAHPDCSAAATGETDFCAWTPDEAKRHALHACAWLGACETPMGKNAFGPCYFRALMAFDCAANPDHRAKQTAHSLWDCLQQVTSCGDVDACIFGDAPPPACHDPDLNTACPTATPAVRVPCADGGVAPYPRARGENCALWGQTCVRTPAGGVCAAGETTGLSCVRECAGRTSLRWCTTDDEGGPAVDQGIDCASNGAMQCGGFPAADAAQWLACRPEGGGAACAPDASATCDNGRAVMCPSGVVESLDCTALLGSAAACSAGALSPPFDWTSPCSLPISNCSSDSCDGTQLTSCERGAAFQMNCAREGLGACSLVATDPGSAPRAVCGAPSP